MTAPASFHDVIVFAPELQQDALGSRYQSYNALQFDRLCGYQVSFVQDNHSKSQNGVLRGLHYQLNQPQGKLLEVVAGSIFDVVVDVRRHSPTFGRWSGLEMSAANRLQRWVPEGFAHGFVVTSEEAELLYKTSAYWAPEDEHCILWNDPALGIDWPLQGEPIMSAKDRAGKLLADAEVFA